MDATGIKNELTTLGVNDYNYVIFTDGSGTTYNKSCGSCAIVVDCDLWTADIILAGKNRGTNMYAELVPVIEGLAHIEKIGDGRNLRIIIVSDSEVTVKAGNGEYSRNNNGYLWKAFEYFENRWDIEFKHVYRNTNQINSLCDTLAGKVRKVMETIQ